MINFKFAWYIRSESFFWYVFPTFGLNTEIYGVNLCIQSKCSKTPYLDTFHAMINYPIFDELKKIQVSLRHEEKAK